VLRDLDLFLERAEIEFIEVDAEQVRLARRAQNTKLLPEFNV